MGLIIGIVDVSKHLTKNEDLSDLKIMRRNEQAGISYEIVGEELVSWPLYVKNGQMIL